MKKHILIFLCIVALYFGVISLSNTLSKTEYFYDLGKDISGIKFNNNEYIRFLSMPTERYALITHDVSVTSKKYYIKFNDCSDFFPPFEYICLYSEEFDTYSNFIIKNPNGFNEQIYVKTNLILPTLKKNEIDMVFMSLSSNDKDNISDKNTVKKIVECAKSNGKIELDKDIYDYIKKYSADHHCLWLKYEGYPIVEEFHIEETEDGRYIVDQYTPEEYDTIYWEEEAHQ